MKTNQPSWHCIANLGDKNPAENGGAFVMVDRRGIYSPELWIYNADTREMSHLVMTRCTRCPSNENTVSDNRCHADKPAWFGTEKNLAGAAGTCGVEAYALREMLQSACPIERAEGYQILVANFGASPFDHWPDIQSRAEAKRMCNRLLRQIVAAGGWKDGLA
jgi:hypothetical protein